MALSLLADRVVTRVLRAAAGAAGAMPSDRTRPGRLAWTARESPGGTGVRVLMCACRHVRVHRCVRTCAHVWACTCACVPAALHPGDATEQPASAVRRGFTHRSRASASAEGRDTRPGPAAPGGLVRDRPACHHSESRLPSLSCFPLLKICFLSLGIPRGWYFTVTNFRKPASL